MVSFSDTTTKVTMVELTVLWEVCMEDAYEMKCAKYQELVEQCKNPGWNTLCIPTEVGCQGFAGHTLCKVMPQLGILGLEKKRVIKSIIDSVEKATRWLWIKMSGQWSTVAGTQVGTDHLQLGHLGKGV